MKKKVGQDWTPLLGLETQYELCIEEEEVWQREINGWTANGWWLELSLVSGGMRWRKVTFFSPGADAFAGESAELVYQNPEESAADQYLSRLWEKHGWRLGLSNQQILAIILAKLENQELESIIEAASLVLERRVDRIKDQDLLLKLVQVVNAEKRMEVLRYQFKVEGFMRQTKNTFEV